MARKQHISDEKQIKELRKYLRQSKAAIPGVLIFGAAALGLVLLIEFFVSVPWWVYAFVLWVVPFGLICDGINILYIKCKLKRLDDTPGAISDQTRLR